MLIVLPKGRLLKEIKNLLELIGISYEDSSRKLVTDKISYFSHWSILEIASW